MSDQSGTATRADDRPAVSPAQFGLGCVLLLAASAASLMLVLQAFGRSLPGCGPESGCSRAAASVWGSVPGIGWPTSHVGLAFFLALFAAWVTTRGSLGPALRWIVRIGVLASVVLTVAMIAGGYLCQYCLMAHAANIVFAVVVELAARGKSARAVGAAPWGALAGVFVLVTAGLAVAQTAHDRRVAAADREELDESVQRIVEGSGGTEGGNPQPTDDADVVPPIDPPALVVDSDEPFTGRYRQGPESSPIRIVIFSDYQCPDCRRIEGEVEELVASMPDLSYSHKHFPMNSLCNEFCAKRNFNPHPNACWAARAAEAAGMLEGDEGFWRMHDWLFEQKGSFTDQSLPVALRQLGFDPQPFIRTMMSDQTLEYVQGDIEEAIELGIHFTPMIFINGVELKGWRTPGALRTAVNAVAASNPPARTAAADRPPTALGKYIDDWRDGMRRTIPPDAVERAIGPADAPAQVVVWGDYEETGTASLDATLRAAVAARGDVRYEFRHFPVDESCNALSSRTLHEQACRMAQAAEAAARLGGPDAFWTMHAWLLENQETFTDTGLRIQARKMDLDFDALVREMGSDEVAAAIENDARTGKQLGLNPIPYFWINERRVPRWNLEGEDVVLQLIDAAVAE